MMTYDEMYHEYKKLQAADEIRNLVSNYCFEHNCALQMLFPPVVQAGGYPP